jgi:hypothetical protein
MTLWPWIRNIRAVDAFFFEEEWNREKEALEMEKSCLLRKLNRPGCDLMHDEMIAKMKTGVNFVFVAFFRVLML